MDFTILANSIPIRPSEISLAELKSFRHFHACISEHTRFSKKFDAFKTIPRTYELQTCKHGYYLYPY